MTRSTLKNEILAGLTVTFVGLPVSLGISIASGLPPAAGIISSLVGGLIFGFLSGTNVTVQGPPKSIIVIILGALSIYGTGDPMEGVQIVCAAFCLTGAFMFLLGILKVGDLGDFFPASAVTGLMAAIGVMIVISQMAPMLGSDIKPTTLLEFLTAFKYIMMDINPSVAIIGLSSLGFLFLYPYLNGKFLRAVPAPMWVLFYAIVMGLIQNFGEEQKVKFLGLEYEIGPEYLLNLSPKDFSIQFVPDFSHWAESDFWFIVINISLICSLEALVAARAVDKIDPERRVTKLNRYLRAIGLGTMVSSFFGGLPTIAAILSTSAGINNGARTLWTNFFHALGMGILVIIGLKFLNLIPTACLAAILVHTGYKLTSPIRFKQVARIGQEQFLIFLTTMFVTLFTNLIFGLVAGVLTTFFIQLVSINQGKYSMNMIFKSTSHLHYDQEDDHYYLSVRRFANFFNYLGLKSKLKKIPSSAVAIIDLSQAKFIDHTVMDHLTSMQNNFFNGGGRMELVGLDVHLPLSNHPLAARKYVYGQSPTPSTKSFNITSRQKKLKRLTYGHNWDFSIHVNWNVEELKSFPFFQNKELYFQKNLIQGKVMGLNFIVSDIHYAEGVLEASREHKVSFMRFDLPGTIPEFILEREVVFDKVMNTINQKDINFKEYKEFSNKFLLFGPDEKKIRSFFSPELILFFETHSIFHIESAQNRLLVFQKEREAKPHEIEIMVAFIKELLEKMKID